MDSMAYGSRALIVNLFVLVKSNLLESLFFSGIHCFLFLPILRE